GADPFPGGVAAEKEHIGEVELDGFPEALAGCFVERQPLLGACPAGDVGEPVDRSEALEHGRDHALAGFLIHQISGDAMDCATSGPDLAGDVVDIALILVERDNRATSFSNGATGRTAHAALVDAAHQNRLAREIQHTLSSTAGAIRPSVGNLRS